MKNTKASNRYAKSILDLAIERNQLEQVYQDMMSISQTVNDSRELQLLLQSPVIKPDTKKNVLREIFSSRISDLSNSFINILAEKGREGLLGDVSKAFIFQYKIHNNVTLAEVVSAVPLDPESKNKVDALITKLAGGKTEIKETVDPSLFGGFIVKVGDKMIDSSVASQLEELKREFTENQYIPGF